MDAQRDMRQAASGKRQGRDPRAGEVRAQGEHKEMRTR